MMGKKKLNTIVEQLKKLADPIASLDARLTFLQHQAGQSTGKGEVAASLSRILRKKTNRKQTGKRRALTTKTVK